MPSKLSRGSIWRKWDLHVHSPASALANEFGGDWDAYIKALADLQNFSAIGITDYFSIEGYRRVVERRNELGNIDLILPNVELRLDTLVGKDERRLNYHVLFADETNLSADDIENHFLSDLRFSYDSAPQQKDYAWPISRVNLEVLGKRLKAEQPQFTSSEFAVGCLNATVRASDVKEILESKKSIFGGKYLIILAEEGTSEMSWLGQHHQTRKVLIQGCDAVFTANENSVKWCRGELDITPDKFRSEFKTLKPCFHGSDAHRLDKIGNPDKERFCWIKADPTFEGLKQTLYEPRERVWIGLQPPRLKADYQVIDSIALHGAPSWFDKIPLPLNRDLVTVVGGRGSGKSALAELLAFAGGSKIFNPADSKDPFIRDTFIKKASMRSDTNPHPIDGLKIELRWLDSKVDSVIVDASLRHGRDEEKVKYLPQKFVEGLCAPDHTGDLQAEIERIIFQNLEDADRAQAADFQELRDHTTAGLAMRRKSHEQAVRALNASIAQHTGRIALKPSRERELAQKTAELEALEKQPPSMPQELKAELDTLEVLTRQKQALEVEIGGVNVKLSNLTALEAKVELFSTAIATYNNEIEPLLLELDLEGESAKFKVNAPTGAQAVIQSRRSALRQAANDIRDGTPPETGNALSLKQVDEEITALRAKLQAVEAQRKEQERYIEQKTALEATIKNLTRELQDISDKTEPALNHDISTRLDRYCDLLDLLLEEKRLLEELYRPLKKSLANADDTAKKLGFHSRVSFEEKKAGARFSELLDQRMAVRDQAELEKAFHDFFEQLESSVQGEAGVDRFNRSTVKQALVELIVQLTESADGERKKKIEDQLRKSGSKEEFDNEFYSARWFRVSYALLFDGKRLELLSPGERGIVLLLLYLEAEQSDSRPLIIDQPEDNLDNMSVYPSLVEYFRKRKLHRQIIIITHNPNLVVNTDSDQVIVPSYDGSRAPRIVYRSGPLEDTSRNGDDGIRESVCKVLEGGHEAFRRREEKYSLPQ